MHAHNARDKKLKKKSDVDIEIPNHAIYTPIYTLAKLYLEGCINITL